MDLTSGTQTFDTNTQQIPPPTQSTSTTSNTKSSSFTNGSLKRHHPTTITATPTTTAPPSSSMVVSYKECLKNHAATIGRHALDGCGEFMPSSSSNHAEPRSLTCAACGCHRNFHRRDQEYHHHHHHHPNFLSFYHSSPPPPPPLPHRGLSISTSPSLSPSPSPSPSPISSPSPPPLSHHFPPYSYHHNHNISNSNSTALNMLLALGNACSDDYHNHYENRGLNSSVITKVENHHQKKRYRTKFSQEQKEKMLRFSEKLGWRIQKGDGELVQEFCNEVGVSRGVFKVWMHNNKNNFRKRSLETTMGNDNAATIDEKNVNGDDHNGGVGSINNSYNNNNNTSGSNNDIHRD